MAEDLRGDEEKSGEKEKEKLQDAIVDVLIDDASEQSAHLKEEERRLVRKLDIRLMPILCILYLCAGEHNTCNPLL